MKFFNKAKLLIVSILLSTILASCSIVVPIEATGNPIGTKVGYSSAGFFLGINFDADLSIKSAAEQGGITKISTVEFKSESILGIYVQYYTIVTGE